ncbi:PGL/p-HBAD biosynthesis glycosyltransferase [Bacteroidales bacterium Barb7]|nr:PGL/p-HBAD biosynthesis glycosyltransferase [Bacteroidales bacterium Barb7]
MASPFPATPLITVVTVAYNSIGTLEKTIQSVITQDYSNTEYILIDGGSTDGSIDMIKKYASRLSAWISEKDNGIYHAMNKGIQMASGEWICFLNSGDVFADTSILGKAVQAITCLSDSPQVVYGNILVRNPDGTLTERIAKEPCNIHRMYFCHQSAFVKTSLMKNYLFDERYKFSADLKFFKQCYYNRQAFIHLNLPVVIYDTNGISNTRREDGLRDNIAVVKATDRGLKKYLFLLRLYFVIYWRRLTGKKH